MSRKGIVCSEADILALVSAPASIEIDTSVGDKGIDNYHIDVELSAAFVFNGKEVVESVAKQVIAGSRVGRSELIDDLRSKYRDLIKATLHRSKTDLSAPLINILQFALIKFVLHETRAQMDKISEQMEETLSQQKYAGSRSLMATQQQSSADHQVSGRDTQRQKQLSRHGVLSRSPWLFNGANSLSRARLRWSSHPTTNCG